MKANIILCPTGKCYSQGLCMTKGKTPRYNERLGQDGVCKFIKTNNAITITNVFSFLREYYCGLYSKMNYERSNFSVPPHSPLHSPPHLSTCQQSSSFVHLRHGNFMQQTGSLSAHSPLQCPAAQSDSLVHSCQGNILQQIG
jgi:hypothetical protein